MVIDKKIEIYRMLVEKLYENCQRIQVENERCVMRINNVKKLTRRRNRDVELLKRRLDKHHDSWRTIPMVAPHPKRKIEQKRGPKPKNRQNVSGEEGATPNKVKRGRKQRVKKDIEIREEVIHQPEQQQQQQPITIQEGFVMQQQQPQPQSVEEQNFVSNDSSLSQHQQIIVTQEEALK